MSPLANPPNLRRRAPGWHPLEVSFTLHELARWTGGRLVDAPAHDLALDRLVTDSRNAGPGALFVALAGEAMDGHDYIPAAVQAGASALLCSRAPEDTSVPRLLVPDTREALVAFSRGRLAASGAQVVGITGSAGKTTTKAMIAAVLSAERRVLWTEGNLNTYTGLPMTLAGLEPEHEVFVAEFGMDALGQIAFLARMAPPDLAVVLNVGLAHVGLLGSIENVAAAKRELVEAVPAEGIAILNGDDARVTAMASSCAGRVAFFALDQPATYRATDIDLHGLEGSAFTLHTPDGDAPVELAVPGRHAVGNALAAAATGHVLGVSLAHTVAALGGFRPVAGRLSPRPGRHGATVIDDVYNASPAAMEASLQVLGSVSGRTRVAVLGDMLELGDEAPEAHRRAGAAAGRSADLLVALGDHAGAMVAAAREAGMPADRAVVARDVEAALAAVEPAMEGAIVLVKASRGMALERLVERLVVP